MNLTFTLYENAFDTTGQRQTLPWEKWTPLFLNHTTRTDKNGPCVILATLEGGRGNRFVKQIDALSLDLDHLDTYTGDLIFNQLQKFEYCMYSTFRHIPEDKRVRVILPLNQPITPSQHKQAWINLNEYIFNKNDPQTKDLARLNYLPTCKPGAEVLAYHNKGVFLDPFLLQAAPPIDNLDLSEDVNLKKIKTSLHKIPKYDDLHIPARALLSGAPYAEPGERHGTRLKLTFQIAIYNKELTKTAIHALFYPSVSQMGYPDNTAALDVIYGQYQGAVERFRELQREEQIKKADVDGSPYNENDLQRIAAKQSLDAHQLSDRWIIQKEGSCWFLTGSGEYVGPYTPADVALASSKFLARAPVRMLDITKEGYKYRQFTDVAREAGSLADKIISDLTITHSAYQADTRTMYEAICPPKKLTPKADPEIDIWLKALCGPAYEKVLDWLAVCPDLSKMLCAIYFDGAPGAGKTLFAQGAAKIWTDGSPSNIDGIMTDYNDDLTRCPFILIDEKMPNKYAKDITAKLRSELSITSRPLRRKYQPTSDLTGSIRLVLCANNEFLLTTDEVATKDDLQAIAERFLHVSVGTEAANILNRTSSDKKKNWNDQGIAQHILYLHQTRSVTCGKRFWVEGDVSKMHRMLITGSRWNSLVCEWLIKYLQNPVKFDTRGSKLIQRGKGELLVNVAAIADNWDCYVQSKLDPEAGKIGAALRSLERSRKRPQKRFGGQTIRYRSIDCDLLFSWAERYDYGDVKELSQKLFEPVAESVIKRIG